MSGAGSDRMKKKVIIAESVLAMLEKSSTLFGRGGITILPASSSEDILDLHRDQQADLIVTEHGLPAMGGVKLCSSIRSDAALRDVSLIMICDRGGEALGESQRAGANAILTRPLDPSEIFAKVSHLLMVQDRLAVRVPLRISVDGRDGRNAFVGMSQNISVSGMLIESGRILQLGERIVCSFAVESRPVSVECIVVRAQEDPPGTFSYGVKFLNLDARTFVLIEHVIKNDERLRGV